MEVSPGIHWLEGRAVNMFLCEEADGLTLVDAGMPRSEQRVLELIGQIGRTPTDLKHILITHADVDHAGSLAAIQTATGAKVYAGEQTAAHLIHGRSPQHMPRPIQFVLDHFIKYRPVRAENIETVHDGDILPFLGGVQVLATPGHTLDHHSFYCSQSGVLFAGDALNTRNGRLQRTPKRITADQNAADRSAVRLLELAPVVIACGHGRPFTNLTADDVMAALNVLHQPLATSHQPHLQE